MSQTVVGELVGRAPSCLTAAFLHRGTMRDPAANANYVDLASLLKSTAMWLKPLQR